MNWPSGKKYQGYFKHNKKHGYGYITTTDGTTHLCKFTARRGKKNEKDSKRESKRESKNVKLIEKNVEPIDDLEVLKRKLKGFR